MPTPHNKRALSIYTAPKPQHVPSSIPANAPPSTNLFCRLWPYWLLQGQLRILLLLNQSSRVIWCHRYKSKDIYNKSRLLWWWLKSWTEIVLEPQPQMLSRLAFSSHFVVRGTYLGDKPNIAPRLKHSRCGKFFIHTRRFFKESGAMNKRWFLYTSGTRTLSMVKISSLINSFIGW